MDVLASPARFQMIASDIIDNAEEFQQQRQSWQLEPTRDNGNDLRSALSPIDSSVWYLLIILYNVILALLRVIGILPFCLLFLAALLLPFSMLCSAWSSLFLLFPRLLSGTTLGCVSLYCPSPTIFYDTFYHVLFSLGSIIPSFNAPLVTFLTWLSHFSHILPPSSSYYSFLFSLWRCSATAHRSRPN